MFSNIMISIHSKQQQQHRIVSNLTQETMVRIYPNSNRKFSGMECSTYEYYCDAGSRQYKVFTPKCYDPVNPTPLIVMLHGCKQTADDFAVGTKMNTLAEEFNFIIAYPQQCHSASSNKCWNWHLPKNQHRDNGEPAIIAGIAKQISQRFNVDRKRIYAAGMSAGAALASVLSVAYPDVFAAVGLHSGLPAGSAHNVTSAFSAMRKGSDVYHTASSKIAPAIIFHGKEDQVVNVKNADNLVKMYSGNLTSTIEQSSSFVKTIYNDASSNDILFEKWIMTYLGHHWCGGDPRGSYTDPKGPDASKEMIRFFLSHPLT